MHTTTVKKLVLAVSLASAALAAHAHRQWMIPTTTVIESDREAWVTIDGATSEGLFEADFMPLKLDGLTVTDPDGATAPAPAATVGKHRSTVDIRLPKDGTYRITLAAVNVMGSYKLNGETKRFRASEQAAQNEIPAGAAEVRRTTMVQRQDTFVTLNKASAGALKPVGRGLEMVAVTHPNELHAGDKARLRFLLDGKPLPNFPFSMIPGGVRYRGTAGEVRLTTDANGEASFTLPAPNMYWLSAAYPANAPRGPGAEGPAESKRYSYSATFEILPE
ncbi:DUF4198 domain-containing protein [Massilia forsythiae]|uniref:DUF4198 domain-containing protein n=1 Tax=Massilia forsythiae TaxID=2728020 RepID=A0A7Z2VXF9_9BURK|nr:DUF4198 domain-containing protein [Massilia forsythiae]QJE01238.1 DUF4198 domain-containing protein [Massilia forsythiae]